MFMCKDPKYMSGRQEKDKTVSMISKIALNINPLIPGPLINHWYIHLYGHSAITDCMTSQSVVLLSIVVSSFCHVILVVSFFCCVILLSFLLSCCSSAVSIFCLSILCHSDPIWSSIISTLCLTVNNFYVSPRRAGRHLVFALVLCPSVCLSVTKSCLLCNSKTIWDILTKLHTNVKQHDMTCRAQEP